jgi:Flp pilus assembly protein CpaB
MRWERLAALGLLVVALGAAAIYALILWSASPAHASGGLGAGGIDGVNFFVTVVSVALPVLAVISVALAESVNMFDAAKREPNRGRL